METTLLPKSVSTPTCVMFTHDTAAFMRASKVGAWGIQRGERPLASYFSTENWFSRRFGIEIEFNSDYGLDFSSECYCECACDSFVQIAALSGTEVTENPECHCFDYCECGEYDVACNDVSIWLYEEGFLDDQSGAPYHAGAGNYDNWRYEADSSVTGGEVISPIMEGSGESWATIAKVMSGIEEQGGSADKANCGGHISIDVSDFTEKVDLARLILLARKFEDVMYRLATNPYRALDPSRSTHRGFIYARPLNHGDITHRHGSILAQNTWLHHEFLSPRLEFRIFDGTLDPALAQTWALVASAFVDAAKRDDIDEILTDMPDRPLGWHLAQRGEGKKGYYADLSHAEMERERLAVCQFVDLLFTRTEDKERVIALTEMNYWNEDNTLWRYFN